jgi:hypothetical protein
VKEAWTLYKTSLVHTTRKGYRVGWRNWTRFAIAHALNLLNPTELDLVLWLIQAVRSIQHDSAVKYLYGVRDTILDLTGADILRRKPRLKKMRRALLKAGGVRKPK